MEHESYRVVHVTLREVTLVARRTFSAHRGCRASSSISVLNIEQFETSSHSAALSYVNSTEFAVPAGVEGI